MIAENIEELSILEILQKQEEFYSKTTKNTFFKKSQKEECAKFISSHYPLDVLIQSTIVVNNDTKEIIFHYLIFKLYVNPDNYKTLIQYMIKTFSECSKTDNFTLILDANTITPTALERYSYFITEYKKQYEDFKLNTSNVDQYSSNISRIRIINMNSFLENFKSIIRPFCEQDIYNKIEFIGK